MSDSVATEIDFHNAAHAAEISKRITRRADSLLLSLSGEDYTRMVSNEITGQTLDKARESIATAARAIGKARFAHLRELLITAGAVIQTPPPVGCIDRDQSVIDTVRRAM